jgi:Polysaccharide lyase
MLKSFAVITTAGVLLVGASADLGHLRRADRRVTRPAPHAAFTFKPANPVVGRAVHFDGTGSACGGRLCTYTWEAQRRRRPWRRARRLGSGQTLDVTFRRAGRNYVRLTVVDARGRTAWVERDVPVTSSPRSTCSAQPFCADYETGDFSRYGQHEWSINNDQGYTASQTGNSAASIIRSPSRQGRYAARFRVFPTTGTSPSDRAEAVTSQDDATGDPSRAWFYGWWTYFPGPSQSWWCGSTCSSGTFNDITQFGQYPNGLSGANWLYMGVDATHAQPRIYAQYVDEQTGVPPLPYTVLADPLQYDRWYHFVVEARWSFDPSVGYISIWVDGVNVVPKRFGKTLSGTATQVHVSQGIYRAAYTSTNTVIHDGLCRAATYEAAAAC